MTTEQLISKIETLGQIKPRKDWVILVKNKIIEVDCKNEFQGSYKEKFLSVLKFLYSLSNQKKLAYAFSVILFIFIGILGFAQYTLPGDTLFSVRKITEKSQASITGESNVKASVENFKKRSQDLVEVVKNRKDGNISSAIQEVKNATKDLTDAIVKNPKLAKEIALEVKDSGTLLNVSANEDLKETSIILYKTIVEQLIKDSENITLTPDQQEKYNQAKVSYEKEDFVNALEIMLLINNSENEN